MSVARAIVGRLRDSDWAGGLLVCALFAATQACYRAASPVGFFDEGITFAAVSWARDGVLALGDAYTPYGPGMALPGLIGTSVVAREAGVILAADAVAGAVAVAVAYAAVRRRAGMAVALGVALMATLGQLPRYALPIACLLLACYLVDRRLVRSSGSLPTAVRRDGRGIGLAAAPIGLAAWFRPEWAVFLVPWAFVVWQACRFRRPALLPLLGPVAVAAVPLVALLATGGFRHIWWWLDYALFHYGSERATPYSLPDAWAAFWSPPGSDEQQQGVLVVVTYGAAAALLAARIANAALPAARRFLAPDRSGLSLFLVLAAALAARAQAERFFPGNGAAVAALVWCAVAWQPFRHRAVVPALVCVAVLAAAPTVWRAVNVPRGVERERDVWRSAGQAESVPGLRRLRFEPGVAQDLATFRGLWQRDHPHGARTFVVNLRNQDAWGNNMIVYWLLRATPAAWPATFDPGFADRREVQRDALRGLCQTPTDVIQHTASYEREPYSRRGGSLLLDQALALGWDDAGGTGLHRIMRPRRDRACPTEPEAVPSGDVASRRDALIRDDRLAAAGVLSRMLVDRAIGLDRRPGFRDTAVALLGGWSVPDRALLDGDDGVAARALRDGARGARADATPARRAAVVRAALDRGGDPFVRLVALRAYREQLIAGAPERERSAVIANATRLARRYPNLPVAVRGLTDMGIVGAQVAADFDARGTRGRWFRPWAVDQFVAGGDRAGSLRQLARLLEELPREPLAQGTALEHVATLLEQQGDGACAAALRARAGAIPEFRTRGAANTQCPDARALRR